MSKLFFNKLQELEILCKDSTKHGCNKKNLKQCDVKELGSGNFGIVKKCITNNKLPQEYAVKMVKNLTLITKEQEEEEKINLVNEVIIMINIGDHSNIIKIMGFNVSPLGDNNYNISLLLEICNLGSLKSKLLDLKDTNTRFDTKTLHKVAFEISNGMAYLEKLNIIHNDLATRNILLSSINYNEFTVKISDFGLSMKLNDIDSKLGYTIDNSYIPRPILWLSPEALINNMFSNKSDIWSFGIVLYEIGIYGDTPLYKTLDGNDFILSKDNIDEFKQMLINGLRHKLNGILPKYLESIMYSCWKLKTRARPSFKDIIHELNLKKMNKLSIKNKRPNIKNKRSSIKNNIH
jgi:serine/threonine protein kinase